MQRSVFVASILSAWFMALVFDWIEKTTGARVMPLLCVAAITMIFGLYKGLYASNEYDTEKEL